MQAFLLFSLVLLNLQLSRVLDVWISHNAETYSVTVLTLCGKRGQDFQRLVPEVGLLNKPPICQTG